MNVLIIGIAHELQGATKSSDRPEPPANKQRLIALVNRAITKRHVQFVGEEASPNCPTIAQEIAREHNPPIPWRNINMPIDEEKRIGIYDACCRPMYQRDDGSFARNAGRIPEDGIREDYFFKQAQLHAGDSQCILILCGDLHAEAMKEKFERQGSNVEIEHCLIEGLSV